MRTKLIYYPVVLLMLILSGDLYAQKPWKQGMIVDEFIYNTAPFPECHSATIAETKEGLVAAFFGGTKERNPDVEIWLSRLQSGRWTPPGSSRDNEACH